MKFVHNKAIIVHKLYIIKSTIRYSTHIIELYLGTIFTITSTSKARQVASALTEMLTRTLLTILHYITLQVQPHSTASLTKHSRMDLGAASIRNHSGPETFLSLRCDLGKN